MAGVWSSGGNVLTARYFLAGAGIKSAGLSFGGTTGSNSVKTEEYDGDSWSSGGDLALARKELAGCGTQSAGLSIGGYTTTHVVKTEEYNGTAWSLGGDLIQSVYRLAGAGTQSAGLSFGGYISSRTAKTEEYNGTAWSTGGNLATSRYGLAGCGTLTAGLSFGGAAAAISAKTEEYNGTAWSSGGDLGTARYVLGGCGTQLAGLSFGGWGTALTAKTEEYNGTAWSSSGDLSTARRRHGSAGTQDAGLAFAGWSTSALNSTEEYSPVVTGLFSGKIRIKDKTTDLFDGRLSINTIINSFDGRLNLFKVSSDFFDGCCEVIELSTDLFDGKLRIKDETTGLFDGKLYAHTLPGVWSSGGNVLTGRHSLGGCGAQTAGLNFGGEESGDTTSSACEEYNGTAWSTGGTLGTGRRDLSGCGTQSAGLNFGGVVAAGNKDTDITEEYNGIAWSSGGDLAVKRKQLGGCGTQSAGLSFGGDAGDVLQTKTEEYNGAAWSAGGDLTTAREWLAGAGTQSAGLSFGGYTTSQSVKTEKYNGTAWSSGPDLVTARSALAGAGTQTAGLSFGGTTGSNSAKTEECNGIAWWTSGNLSAARYGLGGCGSDIAGLSFGGYSLLTNTEEYDPGPPANFINLFDGKLEVEIPQSSTDFFDGKVYVGCFSTNLFDSKLRIQDEIIKLFDGRLRVAKATFNSFDGWLYVHKVASNPFDGRVKIQYAPTELFDGIIRIKDEYPSLLDGKIRIWDETISLFDGWIHLLKPTSNVFDGKATVSSPGAEQDFFDGKIQIGNETTDLFDGKVNIHTGMPSIWAYRADLSVSNKYYLTGTGVASAALCIGGSIGSTYQVATEEFNGTAWSLGGDISAETSQLSSAGTQWAALVFGGFRKTTGISLFTEEYNGFTWSAGGDLPTALARATGTGLQTAALCIGGYYSSGITGDAHEYNGIAWSSGGDLITARDYSASAGLVNAALVTCGRNTSAQAIKSTEHYNGTAWSVDGDSAVARANLAGCGSQTSALNFGGSTSKTTEEYDGTSWSAASDMNRTRGTHGGCGAVNTAMAFGGAANSASSENYAPQNLIRIFDGRIHLFELDTPLFDGRIVVTPPGVQEFDGRIHLYKSESNLFNGKVTVGTSKAWRMAADYPNERSSPGSAGGSDQTGIGIGGMGDIWVSSSSYTFNGVVWSYSGSIGIAVFMLGAAGDSSAALAFGGEDNNYDKRAETYEGDGSTWTAGGNLSIPRMGLAGCGSATAALGVGGTGGVLTEEYNGTAWSSGGDLGISRSELGACGTQSAGLCFCEDTSEEYNGTAWSAGGSISRSRTEVRGCGLQTAAMCIGGANIGLERTYVDEYDGTSWAVISSLNTARKNMGAFGGVDDAVATAGWSGVFPIGTTEKYSSTGYNVFDGKAQIKNETIELFDGKAYISNFDTVVFDGRITLAYFGSDLFDGKLKLYYTWREKLLGGFGEPYKFDIDSPLGSSSRCNIIYALVVTETRSILLGLGNTIEYLLHIPLAQTERQQVVNHLSDSINAIQILLNDITVGDPFSGRLPLLTSIQSESGIQSLVNELSGILVGAQKVLTALTESVSSQVSLINELALKNDIQSLLVLLGSMPDPAVTHISPKLGVPLEGAPPSECAMCIYLDGIPINNQITDLSFVMDREVTFDVLSFSSSDVQLYAKLQEIVGNKDSTLEIQYRGTSWFFLIEEVSGYELSYNVWGRSIAAAKSDAPFEDSVNFVLGADTLASVVAEDLVPNLSVTWNVVDWTVLADWSVDGTPVQMLKELADSVGAVVRSYPDGTGFYVDEKYTTRPIDLLYAESVEDYDRDVDLISLDASRDLGTRTNAVTVHGHTPFSKYSIRLEAESCVDVGNPAVIKVYPALEGAGYKLIASDGVPVYQHSLSEEHIEIVSFEGGKGSVNYPITELKSITWDGVIPAGFEHTPGQNEIILTDDTLAAVGEVVYSTRYDVWHGTHSGEGQLLVVCYLDEGGGIVAKVYFGEGDREADDIDRPILTSIEAAVAAGQAFLDDTSYNRLIRAITVPCSGVSDGDVVSVLSDLSGVTGNTFVLRHEISARIDNEALKVISNLNVVQFEV